MDQTQSIRTLIADLERDGELVRIADTINAEFEVSAFLSMADRGPALLFESLAGSPLRIVGNLFAGRERIAKALDIEARAIQARLHEAIRDPLPPRLVDAAPVQEHVDRQTPLSGLPVPRFFEHEKRAYITAGVILARDPQTGHGNASFARLAILDERRAMIGIAPNHHLAQLARKAAAMGESLEIAVVIGAHPAIQLAACLYLGLGDDEIHCAGRLLGEPVRLVKAKTVDLAVPAEAEIVLEGRLSPGELIEEGLVSEYHGMYEHYGPGQLVTFDCITRRSDAILQVIEPGLHREHIYLGALPIAAGLREAVARVLPNVGEVAVTEAGGGRTDVVIQLAEPRRGQAKRAIFAAWAAVSLVKRVTVVDSDIDPWNANEVDWARMTRMKAERDIVLVEGVGTDRSEPLEAGGLVTKIGFDATAKNDDRVEGVGRALPPKESLEKAAQWFEQHLDEKERKWLRR